MPRKRISEFRAKENIVPLFGGLYEGCSIDVAEDVESQLSDLRLKQPTHQRFAVKVDQGVKGRFAKGLVALDVSSKQLIPTIKRLAAKGYRWFLVEPMTPHSQLEERYLALQYTRGGLQLLYASTGGVTIEARADQLHTVMIDAMTDWPAIAAATKVMVDQLQALVAFCRDQYIAFLEINPYVVDDGAVHVLDAAVEVDDAGAYFATAWNEDDVRRVAARSLTPQEVLVSTLDHTSPASYKLDVINPDGSIFLLLSGGGASVVVADELYARGFGAELANYGEYSGNPTTEETKLYAAAVLELLLASKAPQKVLFIGGAVANFTDVAATFAGIVRAFESVATELQCQNIKVFVRRGGPRQEAGLAAMRMLLAEYELLGAVHGPDISLPAAVEELLGAVA